MSSMNPLRVLRNKIEAHEDEIIEEWLRRVQWGHEADWFSLHSKAKAFVRKNLEEVRILLDRDEPKDLPEHCTPMPAEGVFDGIQTLLVGEEVTAQILRKYQRNLDAWLLLRRMITRVFHRALRLNTCHACEECRHRLDESLLRGIRLKDSIEKAEGDRDVP